MRDATALKLDQLPLETFDAPTRFAVFWQRLYGRTDVPKGKVEHIDAIIDYRFSEPFGSTGLFAGAGLYRQRATLSDVAIPELQRGNQTETNYGLQGGVNGDFPITRRSGFIAELVYHWINYNYKVRYLTLSGGLRFSF